MLQKVACGYTTPISKFKSNPSAALKEAAGDAIAVSAHNQIQFYAVPAELFEEMTNFCEYAQRGMVGLKSIPASFSGEDIGIEKVAVEVAERLLQKRPDIGPVKEDYEEWP